MSDRTFDIKASNLTRHINKLNKKYLCDKTVTDGKTNFAFKDKDGFILEEFSFNQADHPAMIRLISKITERKKQNAK